MLTAHRSLSQLTTSFIGSQCQGIHPALLFALPFALGSHEFTSWLRCSILPDFFKSFYTRSFLIALLCFVIQFSRCLRSVLFQEQNSKDESFHLLNYILESVVGTNGFEPSTSRLSGVRSNHLSYAPIPFILLSVFLLTSALLVEMRRIELLTPCLQGRCSPS